MNIILIIIIIQRQTVSQASLTAVFSSELHFFYKKIENPRGTGSGPAKAGTPARGVHFSSTRRPLCLRSDLYKNGLKYRHYNSKLGLHRILAPNQNVAKLFRKRCIYCEMYESQLRDFPG